jgi:hypothetical protein
VVGLPAEPLLPQTYRRIVAAWIVVAVVASVIAFYRIGPDQDTQPETAGSSVRPDGPGTTEPGILLVVAPSTDTTFAVTELVRLYSPTSSITVRPPDFTAAGARFKAAKPYASKVRITSQDESVQVPDGIVNRTESFAIRKPTQRYAMRYELNRAIVRSKPSTAGRALGAIRPLTSGQPDSMTVAVVAVGREVRNLSCPALPLSLQSCALGKAPLLHVRQDLPWRTATVVVQLDLPDS